MTVIGLDDTDSRSDGMCSTYLAALLAEAIDREGGAVRDLLLVRLNPAVEHKTRGNAALAVHADVDADRALELAADLVETYAVDDDPETSPGVVVADRGPADVPAAVAEFSRGAVRDFHDLDDAVALAESAGFAHRGWAGGRGRIGALAAVGADRAFDDWTVEHVSYREFDRCGTPRDVDADSVFRAADEAYPAAWDTVDRAEGEAVCVPSAPGPILYGVRGDDPEAVRRVADGIDSERVDRAALFRTNQGTDAHLRDASLAAVRDGHAYRVDCEVAAAPETRRGGHVFFSVEPVDESVCDDHGDGDSDGQSTGDGDSDDHSTGDGDSDDHSTGDGDSDGDAAATLDCAAFEPTKRFRDRVRALRVGDELTVCGEVTDGTLKLEKFAVRDLVDTEPAVPECPGCGRSMESAGRNQGYRCRDCGTDADGKVDRPLDRDLEPGWYEVPPCARRHVAKPLVRGGFDVPTHPER
ncbi:TiaS agmantine-binding domain-containing protein [Halobaculum sp. D14]|uniref:TiaS agmantine-binding domain-containing protein n=1 Tax=Halobaculum sp. D14 TaxID=3421642 RepID=UPI003EBB0131